MGDLGSIFKVKGFIYIKLSLNEGSQHMFSLRNEKNMIYLGPMGLFSSDLRMAILLCKSIMTAFTLISKSQENLFGTLAVLVIED